MPPARYATAEPSGRPAREPREARNPGPRNAGPRGAAAQRAATQRTAAQRPAGQRAASQRPAGQGAAGQRAARQRAARPAPALRWVNGRAQIQRVRWDRVGRVALVIVLAVVALLYIQHAIAYVQARSEADHQQAIVTSLERQNAALARQQKQLNDPATIIKDARELGMVWMGERPYAVNGLPNH
jgi:cell division protein FtsB